MPTLIHALSGWLLCRVMLGSVVVKDDAVPLPTKHVFGLYLLCHQVALAASGDEPMMRARPDEELHPYTHAILAQPPPQHLLARLRALLNTAFGCVRLDLHVLLVLCVTLSCCKCRS